MKMKAIVEGVMAGLVTAMVSYHTLIAPVTLAALKIGHKHADGPLFLSMFAWYAAPAVMCASIVLAGVASRLVYKHVAESARREHSEVHEDR